MRPEAEAWWQQAQEDLTTARETLEIKRWYASAFWSQQASEKALKAAYIVRHREEPEKTHNLVAIASALSVPDKLLDALRRIGPAYTIARYPDAANGIPEQMYNEPMARTRVRDAEEVVAWCATELGQS